MNKTVLKITTIVLALLFLLGGVFVYQYARFNDGKLHLIFCDVGQGDGILVRMPQGTDILVDGGPDNKILDCLSKYLPFWDRDIELVFLSHPHADHLTGLISVLKDYRIGAFITEALSNNTAGYAALVQTLSSQAIKSHYVYAGDKFKIKDGVAIQIVGPSKNFLETTSPSGLIGENNEFASLETLLQYKNFSALLTGDSQVEELKQGIDPVSILQVPHHGSRFGLNQEILELLNPKLAVISVGKNNKYGHPTQFTLDLLKSKNIKILRTDQSGDIEIVSDGRVWNVN